VRRHSAEEGREDRLTDGLDAEEGRADHRAQAILSGSSRAGDDVLSAWLGLGVFLLYAVAALGAAAFTLVHRDA
jgi:hypothetical protein